MNQTLKGIIFDFDGTIYHLNVNWVLLKSRLSSLFQQYGYKSNFTPLYSELFRIINLIQGREKKLAQKLKRESYEMIKGVELKGIKSGYSYKFADEILSTINDLNILVGIVSSNSKLVVNKVLSKKKWPKAIIVGREDVTTMKPSSEGVQVCLEKMNVSPKEVWAVGNREDDSRAYLSSDINKVFILKSEYSLNNDNITEISSLKEVLRWIKNN